MTELEKMQRARSYLDKLANGIDPISDKEIPDDSILNNVRLSRCFFYVSDILDQVIENGGEIKRVNTAKKEAFHLNQEKLQGFVFSKEPIRISDIVNKLNQIAEADSVRKLSAVTITNWLLTQGFLEKVKMPDGKNARIPTAQGENIGLSSQLRQSPNGEYHAVMYSEEAQCFIVDNLDAIVQ